MAAASKPCWIADEMLGRLCRYLRFLGHDTVYARGMSDTEISARARSEQRVLLTRDRDLARRTSPSVLLTSVEVGDQLRAVRGMYPEFRYELAFDRCPECNEPLRRWTGVDLGMQLEELPVRRVEQGLPVWECPGCRRRFWDGSHSDKIRELVGRWLGGTEP